MNKILLFLLISTLSFSQNKIDSVISVNKEEIKILRNNLKTLEDKHEYQLKINEQTLNSISSQLEATSLNISIFAILFGICAIILGIYVTWVERKIINIRGENEKLLEETRQNKQEVVAINNLIQKDIYGLFLKIKREETLHILNRLISIPEDVSNVSSELLSRELYPDDFALLKKAFLNLKPEEPLQAGYISLSGSKKDSYLLLFFQHFLEQSVKDDDINTDLVNFYPTAISCAFENDILKSANDFFKGVEEKGIENTKNEIQSFFNALSNSKFKKFNNLYERIFSQLKSKNNQYDILTLIDNNASKVSKINLGKLFVEKYENQTITDSEKQLIEEVKLLIEEEKKAEEEKIKLEEEQNKLDKQENT